MPDAFGSNRATFRDRLIFGVVALTLCVVALLTFLHAERPLLPLAAFLPAYSSAVIITDLITAYLLFAHVPLSRKPGLIWIAGAYLFSAAVATCQMLVFPGVWSPHGLLGAGSQSAVWLWVFWHGGFPAFVLVSTIAGLGRSRTPKPTGSWHGLLMAGGVLALVMALLLLVTRLPTVLPPLIANGHYQTLSHSLPGYAIPILNAAALVAVLLRIRSASVLDLGLAIAVLASLIDAILTLHAQARFSLGWYVARAATTVTACSVLGVYLREITWLHARVLRLNIRLAEQAAMDVITGLFNRRQFNTQLVLILRESERRHHQTGLLLIDIDHFKRYNDQYGHLAGDDCLHRVAQAIRSALLRPGDIACRYGGEEFAVILPTTDAAGATVIAQRIVNAVAALAIAHAASLCGPIVSVSIGVGTAQPGTSFEDIIRRADRALYAAKDAGRNQVAAEPEFALAG